MKLRCIIVDDEPIARQGICEDVQQINFLEITGIAENALQANDLLLNHHFDLILLDIEMPKLNGLDFLRSVRNPPMAIVITAYSEYALQGFNLDVIDYLVKPVPFDRLLKACNKAREFFELKQKALEPKISDKNYFFIKADSKFEKISLSDLLFVEAADNYIVLHTAKGNFMTYLTLKNIEEYLPGESFMKVHKSFIVALDKITQIDGNEIVIGKIKIPMSRDIKETMMERTVNNKLIKR
jgi:DNA-binding LytR/AlgR family response regulator